MQSNQQHQKKLLLSLLLLTCLCHPALSQSWSITGNANIASATQYLGTKDPNDLVFRTNAIERGRVLGAGGAWRFGTATNFAKIDSMGRLTFKGTGVYQVAANRYVFQYATTPNYGLFFNTAPLQYEFRNSAATPVFTINATTGAGSFAGTLKVGAYTLPATDGSNGQVLKTNGSGAVSWSTPTSGWSLTGNGGTSAATNFIGTTDNKPFIFKTNNLERLRIGAGGNVGIGTTVPKGALNVVGAYTVSLSTPGYLQLGDSTSYNMGIDYQTIQSRNNANPSTLFLNSYGGTTQVGNSSSSFQGILAAGRKFGVYAYAPDSTGVYGLGGQYGGYFENFSGIGLYGIDDGTEIGRGVFGYETGKGEALHGEAYGTIGWGVYGYSAQNYGVFGFTGNPASYAGYFNGNVFTTGSYTPSDQKLKQNIQDFTSAMSVISQLHPKQYQYRQDGSYKLMNLPQGQHYGLIAQEVEKVLPGLMKETKFDVDKAMPAGKLSADPKNPNALATAAKTGEAIDFKAINYTELIPIMIKGMQEQQETITAQQKQIDDLKAMVLSLVQGKAVSSSAEGSSAINNVHLSAVTLEQNTPNPLTNSTSIRYNVPAGTASLLISNMNGKAIKTVTLQTGSGTVNIDASTLSAGAYSYSLIVDGKTIATRKMIVAR